MLDSIRKINKSLILVFMLSTVALYGCGGTDVRNQTTTTGQELLDLKAALDAGVISEKEYNRKREDILKGK